MKSQQNLSKYNNQQNELIQQIQNQKQKKTTHRQSPHLTQYYQIQKINHNAQQIEHTISISIDALEKHGITYNGQQFLQQLELNIVCHTINYQIITICMQYGGFKKKITLLNTDKLSPTVNLQLISQGKYGKVFLYYQQKNHRKIAIKSISFDDTNLREKLKLLLKQYFIFCLASAMKLGPQSILLFGFDIIMYSDSIEFGMEYCQQIPTITSQDIQTIKDKLYNLHIFNIVHRDIKPQNLALNKQKSLVFLDFGLSEIIKQKLGFLNYANFRGSYDFCSEQMKEIFIKGKSLVDLYYNDAFGLQKSLEHLQNQNNQFKICNQISYGYDNSLFIYKDCHLISLKHQLYTISFGLVSQKQQILYFSKGIIRQNNYILKQWIKMLPLSQKFAPEFILRNIMTDFNRYNHQKWIRERSNMKQYRQTNRNENFYIRSFNILRNIDYQLNQEQLQWSNHSNQVQKSMLLNEKVINRMNKYRYHIKLLHFIKLNGSTINKADIQQVCQQFLGIKHDNSNKRDFDELYCECIKCIFIDSMPMKQKDNFIILQEILQTLIVLQILPQKDLQSFYLSFLNQSIPIIHKVNLIIQCFCSIQFLKFKFKSNYSYYNIRSFFVQNLQTYYQNCKQNYNDNEKLLFHYLTIFLIRDQDTIIYCFQQITSKYKKPSTKLLFQQQKLIKKIQMYSHYLQAYFQLHKFNKFKNLSVYILVQIIYNNYENKLDYYALYVYELLYQNFSHTKCKQIYKIFTQRFHIFKIGDNFMINFQHVFSEIYYKIQKKFSIDNHAILKDQQTISQSQYLLLINGYNDIIKNTSYFHKIFHQMHKMLQVLYYYENKQYINLVNEIIIGNKEIIFNFPQSIKKYTAAYHEFDLKVQISSIMHLILIINSYHTYPVNAHDLYESAGQYLQLSLKKIACLQCKILTIFQFKRVQLFYFLQRHHQDRAFELLINLISFCYKNSQIQFYVHQYLTYLLRFSILENRKINGYLIKQGLYNWLKKSKKYQNCLIITCNLSTFQMLYAFIAQQYDYKQLGDFIKNTSRGLLNWQSPAFIDTFHQTVSQIVKININIPQKYQFINYHLDMIDHLFDQQLAFQDRFLAIFFLAFLEVKYKDKLCQRMIFQIAKFIDFLGHHSKRIILKAYYRHYLFYFVIKKRKRQFVTKLKVKAEQKRVKSYDRKIIMGLKIQKKKQGSKKHQQLFLKMQKYLNNLDS